MGVPTEITTPSIDVVYKSVTGRSLLIKQRAQDLIDRSLLGSLPVKDVGDFASLIADGNDVFTSAISMGDDINLYAQTQTRTPSRNLVNDCTALQTAITNVRNWINANYPKASNGTMPSVSSLQEYTFDANFRRVAVTVTTAQTAGLRTQLATITAAIS